MRLLTIGDVLAAARVPRAPQPERRDGAIPQSLAEADLADRCRRRSGRAHPVHGGGSLMPAALARDPAFLDALARAVAALQHRD
ncbi:DUF7742 family protein [Acidimangrovimonas sediminis]|uniref:DUF7742 family protein n=1 Tax=Acidimangrovimonas sediminis TaxID=2056283 RepID=UPI000C7FE1EF|nr:hypothetical protein [Acidimangrovimonas sediminis]